MTRRLILIRHAKSSWSDNDRSDHERPLNDRGWKAARAVGEWLTANDFLPDEVIHSTATRAAETWEAIASVLPEVPLVHAEKGLYLASPQRMLEILHGAQEACVLMIGHNPGCAMFAAGMSRARSPHPDFSRYPTCATCVLDFDVDDWRRAEPGQGELVDFIVPRQILAAQ